MNDYNRDFENETVENSTPYESKPEENMNPSYSHEENYNHAMSGTVADGQALSIYRPKIKKKKAHSPVLAAIAASVVTACICCGIFSAVMLNMIPKLKTAPAPAGNTLAVSPSGEGIVKTVVNSADKNALSVSDVYTKASPSVVSIFCGMDPLTTTGSGSGIIISDDGYVVTNNHVIEGAASIRVKTLAGQNFEAELDVLYIFYTLNL